MLKLKPLLENKDALEEAMPIGMALKNTFQKMLNAIGAIPQEKRKESLEAMIISLNADWNSVTASIERTKKELATAKEKGQEFMIKYHGDELRSDTEYKRELGRTIDELEDELMKLGGDPKSLRQQE